MWMRDGMERAPQKWQTSSPWTALALAVVLQAKQDVRRGGRFARTILSRRATFEAKRNALNGLTECRAASAAAFFESPLWYAICEMTDSGSVELPAPMVRDMDAIRRALRRIERDQRKAG